MKEAINEVKSSKYAFLEASQTMLQILSLCNYLMNSFVFEMFLESTDDLCNIIEMGPNLFTGQHVMAWKKDFVYGPLLNYK